MLADDFGQFLEEVRNRRRPGYVGGIAIPRPAGLDERQSADLAAETCSLRALGERWVDISDQEAQILVEDFLYLDLAYNIPGMMVHEAPPLAARFMTFTRAPRTCLTNTRSRRESWHPLSNATFDAGVVCIDAEQVVFLWVEDED